MPKRKSTGVDEYIAKCPKEAHPSLAKVRAAICDVAPDAIERTDYFQWPGYSYPGYDYDGFFVWFSLKKSDARLHVRPPAIQNHRKQLAGYATTKPSSASQSTSQYPSPSSRSSSKPA